MAGDFSGGIDEAALLRDLALTPAERLSALEDRLRLAGVNAIDHRGDGKRLTLDELLALLHACASEPSRRAE